MLAQQTHEELKTIVGSLSRLKYQLQTDKEMEVLRRNSNSKDVEVWNSFLQALPSEKNTFFRSCWLYAECYMYRKIYSFFEQSKTLQTFDYFAKQKNYSLTSSFEIMESLAKSVRKMEHSDRTLIELLKVSLWAYISTDITIICRSRYGAIAVTCQ